VDRLITEEFKVLFEASLIFFWVGR